MAANNNSGGASEDTRTVVTVLLLLFFTPAGLVLMWVWTKWKTWIKVTVTALVVIPLILFFGAIAALIGLAGNQTVRDTINHQATCSEYCRDNTEPAACMQFCLQEATRSAKPTKTK